MSSIREELSDIQHEIWSHWMSYLFSLCNFNEDGSATIPPEKVARWKRQIDTPYSELSESEKDGDRHQADKVLEILN